MHVLRHKQADPKQIKQRGKEEKMLKFRILLDKDTETEWLNSMAQSGWAMTGFWGCFYMFDHCEKGAYQYQIDFTDRFCSVSNEYREFMQEMGVETVTNWGFWTVLRKPASEETFELYTDVDSQIEHYTKIRRMFKIATVIDIICFSVELLAAAYGPHFGYALALLIGACVLALANATFKTNDIIEELKERKTGIASEKKGRRFSPLLLAGMFLNSISLMTGSFMPVYLKHSFQIISIVLMAAGVYTTIHCRRG